MAALRDRSLLFADMNTDISSQVAPFESHKSDNEELLYITMRDRQIDDRFNLVFPKYGWSQDGRARADVALQLIKSNRK